jgi:hypothetical protein
VTKHQNSSKWISNSLSRRDVLRAGGLLLPATLIAPTLFTRVSHAAGSGAFDYYISTNGNDSNPGTLALPWAITAINTKQSAYAGKRLGILPGTYDVSGLMFNGSAGHSAALMINGGPNSSTPTYIGTANSSGVFQVNTAVLDAKGSSGFYGGSNSNSSTVIGACQGYSPGPATPANWGNWILDGLDIINFGPWAVQVGSYDGGGGAMPNCTIQNCRLYNGNASLTTIGINSTHGGPMVIYNQTNCLISNCLFSNNVNTGGNSTHWAAITSLSEGSASTGLVIQYCSFLQTSGFYGVEDTGANTGTTIQYCYFDQTAFAGNPNTLAMSNGMNNTPGLPASSFHHNIVRGGSFYDNQALQVYTTAQNVSFHNNTWDRAGGSGSIGSGVRCVAKTGLVTNYNNLIYDNGGGLLAYGYVAFNADAFKVCDYNIYGTAGTFCTYGANGGGLSASGLSFATWKSAIGGLEVHSSTNTTNPFTNNGAHALQYQIASSSPAYQAGRVGGVTSGAVCNVGAWDGTVTQIGYSAAGASSGAIAQPSPPVLTVVS